MADGQCRTLWIGNIQPTWDEGYVGALFAGSADKPQNVKLMRDKMSGFPVGYGFLDFADEAATTFPPLEGGILISTKKNRAPVV